MALPELDDLLGKAVAARNCRVGTVQSSERIRPPRSVPRSAFADTVSQLFHAENATASMCRLMAGKCGIPRADALIRFQADDERHHAKLYESYLFRLGDIRPVDARIAEALEALLDTSLGPEAVFAGYNIVLEGEALKLQQDSIERFSCPVLNRITRAIGRDEARHVAFGHRYLSTRLGGLEQEKRAEIYRHVKRCWEIAALPPAGNTGLFATLLASKREDYMSARWLYHRDALARTGLVKSGETFPV